MASKRHQRRRSCESKVRHSDEEAAARHARSLGVIYMPYPCPFCGGWHLGRPINQNVRVWLRKHETEDFETAPQGGFDLYA